MDDMEVLMCRPVNNLARQSVIRALFSAVSRLGDGLIWYLLMVAFPITSGLAGAVLSLQMAVGGVVGLITYKTLKAKLIRQRPFASHPSILCATPPLDQYSFPSGHTLHAVLFGMLILTAFPALWPVVVPFVGLIALSRVILGLHYPSDVLVGAILGVILGSGIVWLTKLLLPLVAFAPAA